jgi:hypothetical protein
MSRLVSLPGRRHFEGESAESVAMVLMEITHPDLDAPLRFSTDCTEVLSIDPYRLGTRSTWRGADPETEPFLFVNVAQQMPGEMEDTGPEVRLQLQVINGTLIQSMRSFLTPATCHLALVMSDDTGAPEEEYLNFLLQSADADLSAGTLEVVLSPRMAWAETFPAKRMTQARTPGLFR